MTYQCVAKDGKSFRNTEFFGFEGDRIKRIDVYFGATYQNGVFVKTAVLNTPHGPGSALWPVIPNEHNWISSMERKITGNGGLSKSRLGRMHDVMARHVESGEVPGVVTLVSRHGEINVDAIGRWRSTVRRCGATASFASPR